MSENLVRKEYIEFFIERFIYSVAELENMEKNEEREELMVNILIAFNYLLSKNDDLTLGDIIKIGNKVNEFSGISKGFRKIQVTAGNKAKFTTESPRQIPNKLNFLLYDYYHSVDDPFLKEAKFHIKYMHIHPFEDGNKRSGKLVMASNFWKQGIAPAIITKTDTDLYYEFLNNYDYDGFADFLEQRSNIENNTMCGFYKTFKNIGFTEPVDDEKVRKLILG